MKTASVNPAAWARLLVLRGEAPRQVSFEPEHPVRAVVGSDPSASFRFVHDQVAPRQFDLVWDGKNLWLEDALRLGRTFVNGRRLNEWVVILGEALVSFGPVRLWLTTGGPPPSSSVPDYVALERARLNDAHHAPGTLQCTTGRITLPPEFLVAREES